MAITKIHPIKSTLEKAIKYITNKEKTDEKIFTSSFNCSIENAAEEMLFTKNESHSKAKILARHLIQSFAIGETTPEEAHSIGIKLCKKILKGNYEYVIATHIDKGHIHNHIIFNNVGADGKGYVSNKKTYHKIRFESDKLCREYSLSVIDEFFRKRNSKSEQKGSSYFEWKHKKRGTSWKEKLKNDIDDSILIARDFNHFLKLMKEKGYTIKFGKYLAFKHKDKERFIRAKTIGNDYSELSIKRRIKDKFREENFEFEYEYDFKKDDLENKWTHSDISSYIDRNSKKFEDNKGLDFWANKENLKIMAESLIEFRKYDFRNIEDLQNRISESKDKKSKLISKFNINNAKIESNSEILRNLNVYNKYKLIFEESKKPNVSKEFLDEYKESIIEFERAMKFLDYKFKDNYPTKEDIADLIAEIEFMELENKDINHKINSINEKLADFYRLNKNFEEYFKNKGR
ncbi:MAG: relaxase/mobilization nuclease domain-containing protein [Parvimonas sp.]|uniref:relaxase/mobilization nuclease domain-containing protein n=1 Tax=Parvimonas sp. TaxID=1944660 RepID=UPI0025D1B2AE|nr:relaxase/mobilization nuclease domain-containing protein [Parvimonas sp.]MCI5996852.1 relaxase/mobilization nuclease domain-containing protein [Parvimonas sp.]